MSRIRLSAAALLMMLSGSSFAAGPLPLPVPTLPGLALVNVLPALPSGGGLPALAIPGLALPGLAIGGGGLLPPLPFAQLPGLAMLPGTEDFVEAMSLASRQLPLVTLVNMGDPMLRPLITTISGPVYIPVLGAAFGTN